MKKKIISLRYAEKCSGNKINGLRCCLSSYKSYTADCSCFYFQADYTFGQNVQKWNGILEDNKDIRLGILCFFKAGE